MDTNTRDAATTAANPQQHGGSGARGTTAPSEGRPLRLVLPPTAFAILQLLAEAWPRALTRSELIRRLWDDDPPESDPLRTHLYQLRQQLDKPFDHPMLRTVHGVGFRLDSDSADPAGSTG